MIQKKRYSNLIIIGYPADRLMDELMDNHKKLDFFTYFEEAEGAVILATQNPWNPKGTGAFENVVWVITGADGEEIEYATVVLSRKHELLRNHLGYLSIIVKLFQYHIYDDGLYIHCKGLIVS